MLQELLGSDRASFFVDWNHPFRRTPLPDAWHQPMVNLPRIRPVPVEFLLKHPVFKLRTGDSGTDSQYRRDESPQRTKNQRRGEWYGPAVTTVCPSSLLMRTTP
jgi:hypothetical protein